MRFSIYAQVSEIFKFWWESGTTMKVHTAECARMRGPNISEHERASARPCERTHVLTGHKTYDISINRAVIEKRSRVKSVHFQFYIVKHQKKCCQNFLEISALQLFFVH